MGAIVKHNSSRTPAAATAPEQCRSALAQQPPMTERYERLDHERGGDHTVAGHDNLGYLARGDQAIGWRRFTRNDDRRL